MDNIVTDVTLPVIGNIQEAEDWVNQFSAIITAGPSASEVQWGHPNHLVVEFNDTTVGRNAPTSEHVKQMIDWGVDREDILVHCHAGMSRSTSTAWGIAIARGVEPEDAFITLRDSQPPDSRGFTRDGFRPFIPNSLVVKHLERLFGLDLLHILYTHRRDY
jgi:hypothetical protein